MLITKPTSTNDFFQQQYKKYLRLGGFICLLFFCIIIVASTLINIHGAVTTTGTVVQIGENKSVEHDKGGPVKEILVKDGDIVNKGDILLTLDSVSVDARLALLKQQEFELEVKLDRLQAMEQGLPIFFTDKQKYPERFNQYSKIRATQESVFRAEYDLFITKMEELKTRLNGLNDEIKAINKQRRINEKQLAILDESLEELSALFEQKLISKSRVTQTERDRVNVLTQLESLKVSALQKENERNDIEQNIKKFSKEHDEKIWKDIEKAKEDLAKITSEILAIQDEFSRLKISAPASGRVHELSVKSTNEVIKAGDTILQIVPNSSNFIIHSQVMPQDIDQIHHGQTVRIRFDSLDQHTTPEITGQVLFIAADSSLSNNNDPSEKHFLVKVSLEKTEIEKITSADIGSGLPVSTMFTTNERSLMSYLTKPITRQLFSAFRED